MANRTHSRASARPHGDRPLPQADPPLPGLEEGTGRTQARRGGAHLPPPLLLQLQDPCRLCFSLGNTVNADRCSLTPGLVLCPESDWKAVLSKPLREARVSRCAWARATLDPGFPGGITAPAGPPPGLPARGAPSSGQPPRAGRRAPELEMQRQAWPTAQPSQHLSPNETDLIL